MLREQFMRASEVGGAPCQLVSIGAGYDTTYFQLKSEVRYDTHILPVKRLLIVTEEHTFIAAEVPSGSPGAGNSFLQVCGARFR